MLHRFWDTESLGIIDKDGDVNHVPFRNGYSLIVGIMKRPFLGRKTIQISQITFYLVWIDSDTCNAPLS